MAAAGAEAGRLKQALPRRLSWPIVTLVAGVLAGCSATRAPFVKLPAPESHWVQTEDGWTLHVLRYRPERLKAGLDPVILCHGLSHNNAFWDLHDSVSLAKYLQSRGYDVWSVSLRGCGQSTKPTVSQIKQLFRLNVSVFNPEGLLNRQPGLLRLNWTVDDHIHRDVPAAIDYVVRQSGHPQVHWIGHSMGGMIMFAYLGTHGGEKINSFVAVSSPVLLTLPANDVFDLLVKQADFVQIGNLATGTNLRAVFGTLVGDLVKTPIDTLFLNERNVDWKLLHVFYYGCQEDISPGQLDQLIRLLRTGRFYSHDGSIDYTEKLEQITVPVLQIVGQLDNMAPPGDVRLAQARLGSRDKQFRVFGRINGYQADYGHDDIIIGRHAAQDVYPYILAWLNRHPARLPSTQPAEGKKRFRLLPTSLPALDKLIPLP